MSFRWKRRDKKLAQEHGIPSHLRRYAKRYGVDVETIIRIDKQNKHKPRKTPGS